MTMAAASSSMASSTAATAAPTHVCSCKVIHMYRVHCTVYTLHSAHVSSSQDVARQVKVYNNKNKSLDLEKIYHDTTLNMRRIYIVLAPNRYRSEIGLNQSSASGSMSAVGVGSSSSSGSNMFHSMKFVQASSEGCHLATWPRIPEPNMIHIKYVLGSLIIYYPLTISNIPWNTMSTSADGNPFLRRRGQSARMRRDVGSRYVRCVVYMCYRRAIIAPAASIQQQRHHIFLTCARNIVISLNYYYYWGWASPAHHNDF